jgi:hypothetical protein
MNIATMGEEKIIVCSVLATEGLIHYVQQRLSALCRIFVLQYSHAVSLKFYHAERQGNIFITLRDVII